MKFGNLAVEECAGAILAHGLRVAGSVLKKGRLLVAADVALLRAAGFAQVTVARLEAQVSRLAMPQAEAEAGLVDLGEEMRGYAATLERTVDKSRAQLDQLGIEFTERVEAMSAASDGAVENSRTHLNKNKTICT